MLDFLSSPIWISVLIFILVVFQVIIAIMSADLQSNKGYKGGFIIGLLFGIIGLIYSAGLPDISVHDTTQSQNTPKKKNKSYKKDVPIIKYNTSESQTSNYDFSPNIEYNEDGEEYKICPDCGWQMFSDEQQCSNCGRKNN